VKAWHYFEMLSLFVPARHSPEFVSGPFDIAACTGLWAVGACQLSRGGLSCQHIVLVSRLSACIVKCTCCMYRVCVQHVNTVRWSMQVLLDHTYTQAGAQMITGVLCSSNCAVAAVCQLFWLLPQQGSCKNVHTARYTLYNCRCPT
jgi:hypothetical protein